MRTTNEEARRAKQIEMMEKCFDCYAENGFSSVGIKAIAKACDCSVATLYLYFDNLDDLIIQSTEYCMSKVEDDFMAKAPTDVEDLWRFIDEIPYWTARNTDLCIRSTLTRNTESTARNSLRVQMNDIPNTQRAWSQSSVFHTKS